MSNTRPLVTGLFPDRTSAEAAYSAAEARGYTSDDVNLVMSDDTRHRHFTGTTAGKNCSTRANASSGSCENAGSGVAGVGIACSLLQLAECYCNGMRRQLPAGLFRLRYMRVPDTWNCLES